MLSFDSTHSILISLQFLQKTFIVEEDRGVLKYMFNFFGLLLFSISEKNSISEGKNSSEKTAYQRRRKIFQKEKTAEISNQS